FVRVEDFFKCGYLWAPYIPLHVTPIDLKRAEEQLAIWRAKFKSPPRFVRKEYYGTITVKDLT
ncbi:MAG: hypothetical protein GTN93_26070, partial [Anaerolineae bacterium]|nr:hypothetical protein [Anaerolineae bacterium]